MLKQDKNQAPFFELPKNGKAFIILVRKTISG